jgi:hypothetical protein
LVDELECSVSNEHLLHLFGDSEHDRVAMENSVVWLSELSGEGESSRGSCECV